MSVARARRAMLASARSYNLRLKRRRSSRQDDRDRCPQRDGSPARNYTAPSTSVRLGRFPSRSCRVRACLPAGLDGEALTVRDRAASGQEHGPWSSSCGFIPAVLPGWAFPGSRREMLTMSRPLEKEQLMRRRYAVRGAIWVAIYLLFILAPLFALLGGIVAARARFLDRVPGGDRLRRPGDDGPAIRPHGAVPLRHRAVGRGRHLPLSPSDLAGRGRSGRGACAHSVRAGRNCSRRSIPPGALERLLRRPVDLSR